MAITADTLKRDLADGAADMARTERSQHEIVRAAEERRATIDAKLDEARSRAVTDPSADAEYRALVAERGQLDQVLGR